ncbi:MAG: hypothetical protein IJR80_00655, partial [Treponema sp.]|nr:hypothetical protein [Treponema sp.]
ASGTFNMSGGSIVLNKAGAVSDDDLTFTSRGGGIYNNGTVNLSGNAIIGVATQASSSTYSNYANEYGGGIYNTGTLVFANDATCSIQGNFAKSNGGGLWYSSSSTFTSNTLTDVNNTLTDTRITLNDANSGKQIKKD